MPRSAGTASPKGRISIVPLRDGDGFRARAVIWTTVCLAMILLVAGCSGGGSGGAAQGETGSSARSDATQEREEGSAAGRPNMIFVLNDDLDYASALKMPQIRSRLIE